MSGIKVQMKKSILNLGNISMLFSLFSNSIMIQVKIYITQNNLEKSG